MSAIEREQRRPRCGEDSRARGLHSRLRSGLCYRPLGYERARLSGRRWGPDEQVRGSEVLHTDQHTRPPAHITTKIPHAART